MYTIEQMLEAMKPSNKETKGFSAAQIWGMVAKRESWESIGFSSEEEYKTYLVENPYENIT